MTLAISDIKAVLFDFDETLAIHSGHKQWTQEQNQKFYTDMMNGQAKWDLEETEPNWHMKYFMELCNAFHIEMGLISACEPYTAPVKIKWVKNNYGYELKNCCSSRADKKVDAALAFCFSREFKPSEVMVVDDYWQTVQSMANLGFVAVTPMEVVNYVYGLKNPNWKGDDIWTARKTIS